MRKPNNFNSRVEGRSKKKESSQSRRLMSAKWHLFMDEPSGITKELAGAEFEEAIIVTCGRMMGRDLTETEKRSKEAIEKSVKYWWGTGKARELIC